MLCRFVVEGDLVSVDGAHAVFAACVSDTACKCCVVTPMLTMGRHMAAASAFPAVLIGGGYGRTGSC